MDLKPLLIVLTLVVIFLLEGEFPHFRGRAHRIRHAFPHILTAVLNGLLTRFALAGMTIGTIEWAASHSLGLMRMLTLSENTERVIVFLLFDLWMYFWHMANHRIGFLWRFHRAHHADIEMDTTTALRFHPGELVLSSFVRMPIIVLIGMSFTELVVFEVLLNISTLFHHSNLALPENGDRILRTVIVTPNMHRVHHSIELRETNSNFTSLLSVWDRLAGTFKTRIDTRAITLGLTVYREMRFQRLKGFLITPFLD
jgi:sterol desaturase/sphingolipid hydroxylase (fatty acid hydroxylase superfamily)